MRPKPSLSQVCALLGSALALACGAADENQDAAGASELLERVRADDYSSWSRPPGFEQRTPAQRALQNWLLTEMVHQLGGASAQPWNAQTTIKPSTSQVG